MNVCMAKNLLLKPEFYRFTKRDADMKIPHKFCPKCYPMQNEKKNTMNGDKLQMQWFLHI